MTMKRLLIVLLCLGMFACGDKKSTWKQTYGKGTLDVSLDKEATDALASKPLPAGAEKFKGEFQEKGNDRIHSLIRDYPGKKGFLAKTVKIGHREPGTLAYWYDEEKDLLSSSKAEGQRKFSILKLDSSGEQMLDIYFDWDNNQVDTTIYVRLN